MPSPEPLAPLYDPKAVEPEIRDLWAAGNYFHADPANPAEPYVIVIPPPNVTGALHGGHALNNTLQDILIRWNRMRGRNTEWMPGTDHAGIATQAVVERTIFEKEHLSRHQLGRDELVRRIWEWKNAYGNRIIEQLKLMGCSCDWERLRFTLDDMCARAVRETFFRMFRDGLIIRGKRLVNWDTHLQTAVADDEVYHEKVKGHLWHIKYPLTQTAGQRAAGFSPRGANASVNAAQATALPEYLVVATTRPETMLGDTAVAVHPNDERWNWLIGQKVSLPLTNREIPVIADPILVSMEFGTGCVKVTPAHDPNDYQCALRNNLPMINILTPDGHINEEGGKYKGMDRYAARKLIAADLEAQGLLVKVEDHESDIGHSDRSKTPIEPYLSDQWFVRMGDLEPEHAKNVEGLRGSPGLAQLAIDAICEKEHKSAEERKACGKVHFFPDRYANTYRDWLSEKRDWCISRQLWWGHRIPVWSRRVEDSLLPANDHDLWDAIAALLRAPTCSDTCVRIVRESDSLVIAPGHDVWKSLDLAQPHIVYFCYIGHHRFEDWLQKWGFTQDPDVLDTWFSSALWPHSTMGWPEATPEMAKYYPGNVLSTAREIITLWVARMVLTGRYNVGQVPFHDVYIHTVIQDGQGRPFKKTLGNGFDPVDIIEMYGADALRFTMASLATETQDVRLPVKKIKLDDGRELPTSDRFELGRNFCNKIWNAARFAFMNLEGNSATDMQSVKEPRASARADSQTPENLANYSSAADTQQGVHSGGNAARAEARGSSIERAFALGELPIEDRWMLSRVSRAALEVQDALTKFSFSRAAALARDFFWDSLCDWYLELVKSRIADHRQADEARQVLAFALDQALRLLHPFVPFITERLWKQLNEIAPQRGFPGLADLDTGKPLIISKYPPIEGWPKLNDPAADAVFDDLQTATRAVREIRSTRNVTPKTQVNVMIKVPAARVDSLRSEAHVLKRLAHVGDLTIDPEAVQPKNAATLVFNDMQIFVLDVIDTAAERQRLEAELANIDKQVNAISGKLANEGFVSRAPANVVAAERDKLTTLQSRREVVLKTIAEL